MSRALLLAVVGITAFSISFYAATGVGGGRGAEAHGTHCENYPPRYCGSYYSDQFRCCAYGIQGRIKVTDVNVVDPSSDFTAHWMGITDLGPVQSREWAQMGFTEGIDPYDEDIFYTPELYTEFRRTKCGQAYGFIAHGTPGGLWDRLHVYFTGNYYTCPSDPSVVLYRFDMKRVSLSSSPLATAYMAAPYGYYHAASERLNAHAINPNGTQCFGTNSSCVASTSYGLRVCCDNDQWILWPSPPSPSGTQHYPYNQVVTAPYYSFYTYGGP